MTLFIRTQKRLLEVSDAYVMALSFLLFFAIGKIFKTVLKKQERKNSQNVNMANPRGGGGLQFSDDTELAHTILECIADNERYLVKDPELINIIFNLVMAKVKDESLVLTPNMLRFLALKLINNEQTFFVKIGNIIVSSNNRARLLTRVAGSAVIGFAGALFSMLPYAVLMVVIYFTSTENCGYTCSDYFETLPKEGNIEMYNDKSTGHVFIAGNDDAKQIEIYTPSKPENEVTAKVDGVIKKTRTYIKSRKKAKQVTFSEFRNTDPVLKQFKDLEEPEVPQTYCPLKGDIHDIIDIQVD